MEFTFRRANATDREFLINAITEAEKGPADVISYCAIFSISENEFRELVGKILDEEIEGQEICYSNFIIAEKEGHIAGTLGAFIEMKDGLPSGMIKMNLLMHFLDRDKILAAKEKLAVMSEVNITREPNTLQLEYIYIIKEFGGYGLIWSLLDEHVRAVKETGATCREMHQVMPVNRKVPQLYYEKYGFTITKRVQSHNPDIIKLMACDTKVLMQMAIPE